MLVLDTLEFAEVAGPHHGTHNLHMWHWLSLGYTPAGVEVWNAIRALDYLETRPEVDMKRIGLTGISGGGAMTWYTAAVDERIAAAAPSCSTFTWGSQAEHWLGCAANVTAFITSTLTLGISRLSARSSRRGRC